MRPGKYEVSFRLWIGPSYQRRERLAVELKCVPKDVSSVRSADAGHVQLSRGSWEPTVSSGNWYKLDVGVVTVTDRAGATIRARLWKHSGSWMGDMLFDYVGMTVVLYLVPVPCPALFCSVYCCALCCSARHC